MAAAREESRTGGFEGFGEDLPMFFEGLEADNSKAYFHDHKPLYEQQVRGPLTDLLADLEAEFGTGKVFRPNRDVRFGHDKSPYKTHAAAVVHDQDGKGSLYVHVDADGLLVAGGYWVMARDQVQRYRQAVDDDGTGRSLVRVVNRLQAEGWTTDGEQLKRAPRGFDPEHPRIELLRHKGLAASRRWAGEPWLSTGRCRDVVAEHWRALAPLNRWLARHVGAAVQDATDRDETRHR